MKTLGRNENQGLTIREKISLINDYPSFFGYGNDNYQSCFYDCHCNNGEHGKLCDKLHEVRNWLEAKSSQFRKVVANVIGYEFN